jgi:heptosyltransferase-2
MTTSPTATKTLIVAPSWVGDTVLALPTIEALAASGRSLTVLAKANLLPLLRLVPAVRQTLERQQVEADTVARLRSEAFDESVILPNSFRSAWLPFRAGVPRRWGYRGRLPKWSFRSPLLAPGVAQPRLKGRHQAEDYRELLVAMDVPCPGDWQPRIHLSRESRTAGQALLERAHLDAVKGPVIGLFPGAEFGRSKRWPWQRFAELAHKLRRERPEVQQVLIAGPKEVWLTVRVHEESGKIHPVVGPDLDLGRLAAVLHHLDLMITNDSGPMHLAAALGVPCVALFGPTDPQRTRPYGEQHRLHYTDRWCSPCFRRSCPLIHNRCLKEIEVSEVATAALALLGQTSDGARPLHSSSKSGSPPSTA